jgi:hypothetical protein
MLVVHGFEVHYSEQSASHYAADFWAQGDQ